MSLMREREIYLMLITFGFYSNVTLGHLKIQSGRDINRCFLFIRSHEHETGPDTSYLQIAIRDLKQIGLLKGVLLPFVLLTDRSATSRAGTSPG
jgi:hypothetical protein